mgnify:FL=1
MAIVRDSITFAQDVTFSGSCTFAETPAEIVITSLTGLQLGADGAGTAAPALTLKKTAAGTADVAFKAADDLRGRIRLNGDEAIVIETFDANEASTGTITMGNAAGAVAISGTLAVTGNITGSATVTGADLVATDDLTVGDDAAIAGALTVGETLAVTGTATMAAVNSTALAASTSLTVTGATVVGLHEHVTIAVALLNGTAVYGFASPVAGTITKIQSRLDAALATGNATITAKIGAVAVTTGVLTLTEAGSAAGDVDVCNPSGANTVSVGSDVNFTVGGTNSAAVGATVTVTFLRSA